MHLIKSFSEDLAKFLSRSESTAISKLIKFHDSGIYDFSFPLSLKIWQNYLKLSKQEETLKNFQDNILLYAADDPDSDVNQSIEKIKVASLSWSLQVDSIEVSDKTHQCLIIINKPATYKKFFSKFSTNYGKNKKVEDETINIELDDDNSDQSITHYRTIVVKEVVENLLTYSKLVPVNDPSIAKYKILVTSRSNLNKNHSQADRKLLTVGAVLDPNDKKTSQQLAQDYIKQRQEDMHLISVHKYGVRVKNDDAFVKLMEKLGSNAATLDLLEVKQSSSVTLLSGDPKQSFILYNSARMETLMEKFEKKVAEGYYKELPDVSEIDCSLLKEDEEWLLMKLLLTFPDVIDRTSNELSQGKVSLHLIHKFISSIVNTFSIYYRRCRLLTENRAQLMPTLHAKIHFLRAVRRILNQSLALYGIEPVAFM